MKFLIVLAVVCVGFWLWRQGRREAMRAPPPSTRDALAKPEAMLRCAHCGVHVPAAEALTGPDGRAYCSGAHRASARSG